ncbi:MAG TPA: 2'-5' RNA ligase family protein [Bryobacteraceae bacterium]|nr:2'-5' RNA ligase family protein [Bryobacteraceae bacterium]
MPYDRNCADRIDSFALVSYIPEPLAGFLDRLRQELVPNCKLRAHITALPPRPLISSPEAAWDQISSDLAGIPRFEVELTSIEVFPISDVIYLGVGAGSEELKAMHRKLNHGNVRFREPFRYHPHVTLGQNLEAARVDDLRKLAQTRWAAFPHSRHFSVERLTFVQNTPQNTWVDLHERSLTAGHNCDLVLL